MLKSRFIAISDLHLVGANPVSRKDNLTETQWGKVTELYLFAASHKADIYVAGDFGNHSNNYSILNRLSEIIYGYQGQGVNTYAVYGQHDLKYRNEKDTNLEILSNAGLVTILNSTPIEGDVHKVYGCSWKGEVPVPRPSNKVNVLVIHAPICSTQLFHGHSYIDFKKFVDDNPSYLLTICGDIHRTFMEEHRQSIIINSGPMVRKEADEYNMIHTPGFFYVDLEEPIVRFQQLKHKPAEEVLTRKHIIRKKERELTAARADTAQFLSELRNRTNQGRMMNIEERIKIRLEDEETTEGAREVLTKLLNQEGLSEWLQKPQSASQQR